MASLPRGIWSESADANNRAPAKAVHDSTPSSVEELNKYYLDVANKRIESYHLCLAKEKNRNVHPTSGPVGLDACVDPTKPPRATKDHAGHKLLVIDTLKSSGLSQQGQIQSRNINLLPSQGPLPSEQTMLRDDEITNHEEHASGPSCLDDEPEIADSTAPSLYPPAHIERGYLGTLRDLLILGAAFCAVSFIYIKPVSYTHLTLPTKRIV